MVPVLDVWEELSIRQTLPRQEIAYFIFWLINYTTNTIFNRKNPLRMRRGFYCFRYFYVSAFRSNHSGSTSS